MLRHALAVLALLHTSSVLGAIALTNGSFESPTGPLAMVTTSFSGWTVTDGDASVLVASSPSSAASGSQYLFLPGSAVKLSQVEQTVGGFVAGVEYEIAYSLCGFNSDSAAHECDIEIAIFNHKVDTFTFAVASNSTTFGSEKNPWQRRSFTFTAEGASTAFAIQNYRTSAATDAYAAFDAFTIRVVPKGAPLVTILSKRHQSAKKGTYLLRGTIAASLPVETVTLSTGRSRLSLPPGNAFLTKVRLKKGINRLTVMAIDLAGTVSTATRILVRK